MNTMKARPGRKVLAVILSVAALCATAATMRAASSPTVSGTISVLFTNGTVPVYDLSGNYRFEHSVTLSSGAVRLSLPCAMEQDGTGRLRGSGTTNIVVGADILGAQYTVSGKVTGGGGKATRATMTVRWVGQGAEAINISIQYNLVVSPGYLDGFARGKVRTGEGATGNLKAPVADVSLPASATGNWSLSLNLQAPASGTIALPGTRKVQANATVNSVGKTGRSRVKLTGSGADRGNALTLSLVPATGALDSMNGKLLGQAVALKTASSAVFASSQLAAASAVAGSQACLECHTPVAQTVNLTPHGHRGVQCESCHGPAANHAANDYDPASRPVLDYSGNLCGNCHSGIYTEWKASGHAQLALDFNQAGRASTCGRCHSGSVRVNLLDGLPMPANANQPLGCPTCHQPHELTGQPDQLRNPLYSTNDYYITTTSVFTNQYNPNVNLCAQCHNHRGASWQNTDRPPHESPQYNILLGTVGELASGQAPNDPAYHGLFITNQCVGCHMQSSAQSPTGHEFGVTSYAFCAQCHGSAANASNLVGFVSMVVSNQINTLHASLDRWATNDAPAALSAKYGTRAWEYTVPGQLSPGGPGPTAAEQQQIPVEIWKARFNLYLVLYDSSYGTHNGPFAFTLLSTAQAWVDSQLSPIVPVVNLEQPVGGRTYPSP